MEKSLFLRVSLSKDRVDIVSGNKKGQNAIIKEHGCDPISPAVDFGNFECIVSGPQSFRSASDSLYDCYTDCYT